MSGGTVDHVLNRLAAASVRRTHHSTSVSTEATVSASTGVACAAKHTLAASTIPWDTHRQGK